MRILDRYLLTQFVRTFLICYLSLTGLYVVIDAFGHLNQFTTYSETHGSLLTVIGEYYAYRTLYFFEQTSGILAFISAIFTITWIQRHNEMTAMFAAGVPTRRVIKPIIVAAILVSFFAAANRELVIPNLREELSRDSGDLAGTEARPLNPRIDNQSKILFTGKHLTQGDQRIERPRFKLPNKLNDFGQEIVAAEAFYQPATDNRPEGYLLREVNLPKNLAKRESVYTPDGVPIIFAPQDTDWLKPNECFVCTQLSLEMLSGGTTWLNYSSTPELVRGLHNPSTDFGANIRVATHSRIVQPFLDSTLVLLGIPFVLSRGTRNMFMAIGLCLGIVVIFMLTTLACKHLGNMSLVRPALAAWLPLIIFVPIVAWTSVAWRR